MDYCGPRALPHSEFLSWREDDQEKALWWEARNKQRCSSCHTHPDEWDETQGGHPHAFTPEERICMGCRHKAIAQDQLDAARKAGDPKHGVFIALIPNKPL